MARGQPDYGSYAVGDLTTLLSDMAELAVRLGSIVVFDRRGTIVYTDDFEGPTLKWVQVTAAGGTSLLDSTHPLSGAQCVILTVTPAAGSLAGLSREIGVVPSQRLGFEASFCNPSSNTSLYIEIAYWDGTDFLRGQLRANFNANTLAVWTGAGVWTVVAAIAPFYTAGYTYNPFKLVVDFSTGYYVRGMLGGNWYDLSAYSLVIGVGAGAPRLQQNIHFERQAGIGGSLYVDNCLFTQEEP